MLLLTLIIYLGVLVVLYQKDKEIKSQSRTIRYLERYIEDQESQIQEIEYLKSRIEKMTKTIIDERNERWDTIKRYKDAFNDYNIIIGELHDEIDKLKEVKS